MIVLIKCAECGGKVSSNLSCCPHCGKNPHIVKCKICGNDVKSSERVMLGVYTYAHPTCAKSFDNVLAQEKFRCEICKHEYTQGEVSKHLKTEDYVSGTYDTHTSDTYFICFECGYRIKASSCAYCGKIRFGGTGYIDKSNPYKSVCRLVHHSCLASAKAESKANTKCFIATATYGEDSLEVSTLRRFRDDYLRYTKLGKYFIIGYEYISPYFAKLIIKYPILRLFTRMFIVNPAFFIAEWSITKPIRSKNQ